MSKPVFRNPDLFEVLDYREWIRKNIDVGSKGYTVEDVDLVMLHFGNVLHRRQSQDGRLIICEIKQHGAKMGYAQKRMYQLIDRLLQAADPNMMHYQGFYVINWDMPNNLLINGIIIDTNILKDFLEGTIYCVGLFERRSISAEMAHKTLIG